LLLLVPFCLSNGISDRPLRGAWYLPSPLEDLHRLPLLNFSASLTSLRRDRVFLHDAALSSDGVRVKVGSPCFLGNPRCIRHPFSLLFCVPPVVLHRVVDVSFSLSSSFVFLWIRTSLPASINWWPRHMTRSAVFLRPGFGTPHSLEFLPVL